MLFDNKSLLTIPWVSQVAQWERICLLIQEIQQMCVQSLGQEDCLEEDMATHSSVLAWRIPMDRGASWATVHGVPKNWTQFSNSALACVCMHTHTHTSEFMLVR